MLPIKPHLWFDTEAKEAAGFYTTLLPNSAIIYTNHLPQPANCDVVEFTFAGQPFMAINGGPSLKKNPSISFMIHFDAAESMENVWQKMADCGKIMMPLDRYPFSERYGWVADRYGVSWQLMLADPKNGKRPVIVPSMMFTGDAAGKAAEAIDFYCSIFKDGERGNTSPRPQDMGPDKAGSLMYADFYIDQTWIACMDSAHQHGFGFNDAISLLIPCETQEKIDYYWSALTAGGEPGQCGWLKDKFGVSWQVASTVMFEALKNGSPEQMERVVNAFMYMHKVDVAALQRAYLGT